MSEEPIRDTDVSPPGKPLQGILGMFWAGGQGLASAPTAPENGQGALSPEMPGEWLAHALTPGMLESRPLALDEEMLEHLLAVVREWASLHTGACSQSRNGVPEPARSRGAEASSGQRDGSPAANSQPLLTISTFGRFAIHAQGQEIAPPPRHGEVLCQALLCQPSRQAEFVWLADHLWPEAEADQAMQYLYVASNAVRSTLPRAVLLTHRKNQVYQLAGQEHLWVDADAALALIARVQALGRSTPQAIPLLEEAMRYFRFVLFPSKDTETEKRLIGPRRSSAISRRSSNTFRGSSKDRAFYSPSR